MSAFAMSRYGPAIVRLAVVLAFFAGVEAAIELVAMELAGAEE